MLFEYFEYRNKRGLKLLTSPQSGNRLANFFRDILRSRKNEGYSFHHTVEISETDPVTLRGPAKGTVVNVCFFFFFFSQEWKVSPYKWFHNFVHELHGGQRQGLATAWSWKLCALRFQKGEVQRSSDMG